MRTNGKKIALGVLLLAVAAAVAVPLLMQRGETAPNSTVTSSSGQALSTIADNDAETGHHRSLPTETASLAAVAEGTGAGASEPVGSSPIVSSDETPYQSSRAVEVNIRELRQLLPRDAIAPIYAPKFLSAEDAGLAPDELVIGVEIDGESKAYPIGPLAYREMVNDVIAGVPILVSW